MTPSPRRGGLAWPILLVGLGVLLLLDNLGVIPGTIWATLLQMWPVVLIVFGLDILIARRSVWSSLLLAALILAVLAGAYWVSTLRIAPAGPRSVEEVKIALENESRAEVTLGPAVGALHIGPLPAADGFLEATVPLFPGESLRQDVNRSGGILRIDLHSEGAFVLPVISTRGQAWVVSLLPGSPADLTLRVGAGEIRVNGEDLLLTSVDANVGVGQVLVEVGEGIRRVEVDSGIGQIVIVLPPEVEARIKAEVALGDVDVPQGYQRVGDAYQSPGWTSPASGIEIVAKQAIGQIVVQQAP